MNSMNAGCAVRRLVSCAILAVLAACSLGLPALAQTEQLIHSFGDGSVSGDGNDPVAGVILGKNGSLYGSTYNGGSAQNGCIFQVAPSGSVTILHSFGDLSVIDDGDNPSGALVQASNGTLYGTTYWGGAANKGTVFSITPSGTLTVLHSFGDGTVTNDGENPSSGLTLAKNGTLYGTTWAGGAFGDGAAFVIQASGALTVLHSFGDGSVPGDGQQPQAGLVEGSDGYFYGTTFTGGSQSNGCVYKLTPSGVVTILHSFNDGSVADDGSQPAGGLVQAPSGLLYGTTYNGGSAGDGIVFSISTSGALTILHSFGDGSVSGDGRNPSASMIVGGDGNLYGTCVTGGSAGDGAVFKMTPSGAVTVLHSFDNGSVAHDGEQPYGGLLQAADGSFYGTTSLGGIKSEGTVFRIFEPVRFDFDGDGKADLLWENSVTGQLSLWYMNGQTYAGRTGAFATVDPAWQVKGVADINSDGHPDLLWWNSKTGRMLFWLMSGAVGDTIAKHGTVFATVADTDWQPVSMADFNGDGNPDILWENMTTGQLLVWYMATGAVESRGASFATVQANCRVAGTADFNRDGHPDILLENTKTGALTVWYMGGPRGTTQLSTSGVFATVSDTDWSVVSTGDENGDGHPDLTWRNSSTGKVVVWLMGGSTGTTIESEGSPITLTPPITWSIVGVR